MTYLASPGPIYRLQFGPWKWLLVYWVSCHGSSPWIRLVLVELGVDMLYYAYHGGTRVVCVFTYTDNTRRFADG